MLWVGSQVVEVSLQAHSQIHRIVAGRPKSLHDFTADVNRAADVVVPAGEPRAVIAHNTFRGTEHEECRQTPRVLVSTLSSNFYLQRDQTIVRLLFGELELAESVSIDRAVVHVAKLTPIL